MSTPGYWAVCEEFRLPTVKQTRSPSISMIHVRGFFYADAMGHTRMEALRRVHQKLQESIRFYLSVGNDLPPICMSDMVPRDYQAKDNTTLIFISLKDIGYEHIAIEQEEQRRTAG